MIPADMIVGTAWKHKNENVYLIRGYSNTQGERPKYPPMVEYQNYNTGAKYSRRVDDWHRSMTPAPEFDNLPPTLFAIQRKSDRLLMPDFKGRAGGTYVVPDKRDTHSGTPRLFTTKKAATEALRWWVKGRVRVEYGYGGLDDLGNGPEMTGLQSVPAEGRNAEDWQIVPVGITVEAPT